ncbi:hypothetical protein ACSV3Y_002476 [Escherichia coli]
MNANAKYPAWVFELYARYFEELAPGEEALSIDEYAECLGFKGGRRRIKHGAGWPHQIRRV